MKFKKMFIQMIALGTGITCLSGCSAMHVHTYDTSFEYDETMHWQHCEKCGENLNADTHAFDDFTNTCLLCGYHDPIFKIEDGVMTGLTTRGMQIYEIDVPTDVKFISKDALKGSKITKVNISKEFIGYYEGAFDYNNINITTEEEKVIWTYENGIYYKHNVLEEYEATIGDACFKTLKEAIANAKVDDETITIVKKDLKIEEPLYISNIINIKSYYDETNLECDFQIAGSGILKIESSVNYKGNVQLILADSQEELDESYTSAYKSGTITFIDKETKPEGVYVEYVNNFKQAVGFGYEAVGSKQVVNDLLILPVVQYAYGTFAFSYDFKTIMGLSAYGLTVSELHITNVVKNINAVIASYAFAIWTDIKINIAVIDDTHIRYYQTKGSFTDLYIDDGITEIGYRAFTNEMTEDVFHEVRIMLSLLSRLKTVHIGDSVSLIHSKAFCTSLGLEEVYGARGVTEIGESAFYECLNLKTVDFSEAFKLTKINKYVFGYCDHFTYFSLPRDNWTINGQTFVPHQFTPEVAAYHAVHADGNQVWNRSVNGKICYIKNFSKDACGKFINAAYTNDIQTAINNVCEGGWIYLMEASSSNKNIPITKVTKNLNIVAYDTAKDVTIGTEKDGLSIERNKYITLDNITPLGDVMINCDFTDAGSILIKNVSTLCLKLNESNGYDNINIYYNDSVSGTQLRAKGSPASFTEGIEYMCYGLFSLTYSYYPKASRGPTGKVYLDSTSVLFNSITKVTIDAPFYDSGTFIAGIISVSNDVFKNQQKVKFVTLGDLVEGVGIYAFSGCTSLESISFGKGITHVLNHAFEGCTKLKYVDFGEGNKLWDIDVNTFIGCTALKYVDFNGNIDDWKVATPTPITITAGELVNPYNAAELIKQYVQYDWSR